MALFIIPYILYIIPVVVVRMLLACFFPERFQIHRKMWNASLWLPYVAWMGALLITGANVITWANDINLPKSFSNLVEPLFISLILSGLMGLSMLFSRMPKLVWILLFILVPLAVFFLTPCLPE